MKLIGFTAVALAVCGTAAAAEPTAGESDTWPTEFAGRTFEIVTSTGMTSLVSLGPHGALTALPRLNTEAVEGTWASKNGALCTRFIPRGEECWDPAAVVAARGEVVTVRSHRGQDLKIRLLNGAEEQPGASS